MKDVFTIINLRKLNISVKGPFIYSMEPPYTERKKKNKKKKKTQTIKSIQSIERDNFLPLDLWGMFFWTP